MSALSLNNGSFRRSLGSTGSSVPNTPVLSIFSSTVIVNKDNAGYGMKVTINSFFLPLCYFEIKCFLL